MSVFSKAVKSVSKAVSAPVQKVASVAANAAAGFAGGGGIGGIAGTVTGIVRNTRTGKASPITFRTLGQSAAIGAATNIAAGAAAGIGAKVGAAGGVKGILAKAAAFSKSGGLVGNAGNIFKAGVGFLGAQGAGIVNLLRPSAGPDAANDASTDTPGIVDTVSNAARRLKPALNSIRPKVAQLEKATGVNLSDRLPFLGDGKSAPDVTVEAPPAPSSNTPLLFAGVGLALLLFSRKKIL